jgi:hypothetical protein
MQYTTEKVTRGDGFPKTFRTRVCMENFTETRHLASPDPMQAMHQGQGRTPPGRVKNARKPLGADRVFQPKRSFYAKFQNATSALLGTKTTTKTMLDNRKNHHPADAIKARFAHRFRAALDLELEKVPDLLITNDGTPPHEMLPVVGYFIRQAAAAALHQAIEETEF